MYLNCVDDSFIENPKYNNLKIAMEILVTLPSSKDKIDSLQDPVLKSKLEAYLNQRK